MYSIILIVHTLLAVSIVILVLMQQSGSGAGALGGGASQSFFGSRGSFSLMMKITSVCAGIFFVTSLGLSIVAGRQVGLGIDSGVIRQQQQQQQQPGSSLPSFEEQEQELQQLEEQNQQPVEQLAPEQGGLPAFEEPNTESGN